MALPIERALEAIPVPDTGDHVDLFRPVVPDATLGQLGDPCHIPEARHTSALFDPITQQFEVGWGAPPVERIVVGQPRTTIDNFNSLVLNTLVSVNISGVVQKIVPDAIQQKINNNLPTSNMTAYAQSFVDSAHVLHDIPLFQKVRNNINNWKQIGCSDEVLSWIEHGIYLKPVREILPFYKKQFSIDDSASAYWHSTLKPHYLSSGAIIAINKPPTHRRFVSNSFFVPKSSGGYRLVINLRHVNQYFVFPKVKFECLDVLQNADVTCQYGVSIDVSDAYHHLALHPAIQEYFQFTVDGEYFQAVALPFGWSPAPGIFTKFMRQVLAAIRRPQLIQNNNLLLAASRDALGNYLVSGFIDDVLGLGATMQSTSLLAQGICQLFTWLGLLWHAHKCSLTPQQKIVHLGFLLDVANKLYKLSDKQYRKINERVLNILGMAKGRARWVNRKKLAKAIGYLSSCSLALPDARFKLASLYCDLHSTDKWEKNTKVQLSNYSMRDLQKYWLQVHNKPVGRSWYPPYRYAILNNIKITTLVTDASKYAWGAHYHAADQQVPKLARGLLTSAAQCTGNTARELQGVLEAVKIFAPQHQNSCIKLHVDNIGVKHIINNGFASTTDLRDQVQQIMKILNENECTMFAQYLPGVDNLVADSLSRTNLGDSYRLNRAVFKMIQLCTCTPATVDRFATACNAQLPVFNTLVHEIGTSGVDAFAQGDILDHVNYVFPSVPMLPRVMQWISQEWPDASFIIIFPLWYTQPWFAPLVRLCHRCYVLPVQGSKLFQKVHAFPCKPPVKSESWKYCVGYRHVPVTAPPPWKGVSA